MHNGVVSVAAKASGLTTTAVKFSTAFRAVPGVSVALAGSYDDNAGAAAVLSSIALTATNVSASGFNLQVANATDKQYTMSVRWLAII